MEFVGLNSDLRTLSSVTCFSTVVPDVSFYREARGGGGIMFLLRFVGEHLRNVNNCCYGRCYGKSHILLTGFLKFHCFNARNR